MYELLDINGTLIRQIIGNRNVRRVFDRAPIWEISATDSSIDAARRRLFERILHDFPRMVLRYPLDDEDVFRAHTGWSRLGPSVWQIPGSANPDKTYDYLISREWSMYAAVQSAKIIAIPYDRHHQRIAWMRYHAVPLAIDSNTWRGVWLITANPEVDALQGDNSKADTGGANINPVLDKILGIWVIESDIQPDSDEAETIAWVARMISDDDRFTFIDETEKALTNRAVTPAYIAMKAGRDFPSDSAAFRWVKKAADIFRSVEEIRTGEERLVRTIKNVLDIASFDIAKKGMTVRFDGVAIRKKSPYESAARIRISFMDPPERQDATMSQIELFFVPLYVDGIRQYESTVWENTEKGIRKAIRGGPYVRLGDYLFRTQAALPVWLILSSIVLLIVLAGVIFLVLPLFFPGC